MRTNSNKTQKQRRENEERRQQKQRAAIEHDENQSTLITQYSPRYDVEMIRDFLDQLLLELRVQQYEYVKALRSLRLNKDYSLAKSAAAETSPELVKQLASYHLVYCPLLRTAIVIDEEGVCDEETKAFTENYLSRNIEERDAEIGHLEALQEVIDEALLTAKLTFGVSKGGGVMEKTCTSSS